MMDEPQPPRVAVLLDTNGALCVGPSMTALYDALRPIAFPAWVDPSHWVQRAWSAEALESPGTFMLDGRQYKGVWRQKPEIGS